MQNNDNNNDNNGQVWIDVPSFINKGADLNQVSGKLDKRIEDVDSNEFVREVNSSLAKQVRYDMDLDKDTASRNSSNRNNSYKKKKKKGKGLKVTFGILLTLTILCCLLIFTPQGKKFLIDMVGNYIYGNLDHKATQTSAKPVIKDNIVNILLVGVEEIGGAKNTDSMMIATMNTRTKTLKLTSLMRDIYVHIPGHDDNKLNSAFAKGQIDLLYQTIENNFGIKLDGYCMVNFDSFEQIVNYVGGVKVTLTQEEADYLNHTNYISNRKYRTVQAGTQTLNGNQALGYCRVRKRATSTEHDDFGRTQRQRIVLKSIYSKVRHKNVVEQVILMNKVLTNSHVETDISNAAFNRYLEEATELKVKDVQTLRIPSDGNYSGEKVRIGSRNSDVLVIKDWDATRKQIHDFIYGTAAGTETEKDSQTATGASDSSN